MSFRRYVQTCAWCGGIAAYVAWAVGCSLPIENRLVLSGCQGILFGLLVGSTLGAVDARWHPSTAKVWRAVVHVLTAAAVGALGGVLGGAFSETAYLRLQFEMFRLPGRFCTGLILGAGLGAGDALARLVNREHLGDALVRMRRGALGGALGGFLGGCVYLLLIVLSRAFLADTDPLWSPDAWGTVALGLFIGLGAALAHFTPGKSAG